MMHLIARRSLWSLVAVGLVGWLGGCASAQVNSSVRSVPVDPDASPDFSLPTPSPTSVLEPAAARVQEQIQEQIQEQDLRASASVAVIEAGLGEPLEGPEETISTRLALEQALTWAKEGLQHYDAGDHEAARRSLNDAQIMLLQANLPDAMQKQGMSLLQGALDDELRHHDLEAVAEILELESRPAADLEERELIEREVRRILRAFDAPTPKDIYFETFVDEVQRYVEFYRGNQREFFERSYGRMHKYMPTIDAVFTSRNIPIELAFMALVESGFNPRAKSHANARGLWQFIPSTGRRYGLRQVNDFYDVQMATEAASEYLLDLIGIFGSRSFLLATAAYNAGESRIQRCLRKLEDPFQKRSFWEIRGCLARETREYVPRIMAAAVISADARRFGFELPSLKEVRQQYDVVTIPAVTSLSRIARQAGITVAELRTANTDMASTATATPARNFPLYVPKGSGERLASMVVPGSRSTGSGQSAEAAPRSRRADVSSTESSWGSASRSASSVEYVVRSGDTLSEIGERFGVRFSDVASWNGLGRPYRLRVGQKLVIHPKEGSRPRVVYTVKRGNNLRAIADIFSVRYRDIMSWNNLGRSTLQVGQKLVIHPSRSIRVERYQVRRGDSVARIARRFGVSVQDVLTANGLGSRTLIRPGQRLLVYVS